MDLKNRSAVSTVNLAEVKGKLIQQGLPAAEAWAAALSFSSEVYSFDSEQASIADGLIAPTRKYVYRLEIACLALALIRN